MKNSHMQQDPFHPKSICITPHDPWSIQSISHLDTSCYWQPHSYEESLDYGQYYHPHYYHYPEYYHYPAYYHYPEDDHYQHNCLPCCGNVVEIHTTPELHQIHA